MSHGPSEKRYQQECRLEKLRRIERIETDEMIDESKGFWKMELTSDPEKLGMVRQPNLPENYTIRVKKA